MNILLSDGSELRGDSLLSWVLRSDLAPVPRTVEFTVSLSGNLDQLLTEGKTFRTGQEFLEYQIVKSEKKMPIGVVQGGSALQSMHVIAILRAAISIASRSNRAVVIEDGNLRQVYASCGARFAFGSDITVGRFSCFKGQVPSFAISQLFQEQQVALTLKAEKSKVSLNAVRLKDLFRQKPKHTIGQSDTSGKIESIFLENDEIPSFFSTDDDGSFVSGDMYNGSPVIYQPRSSEATLRNMGHVLVRRRLVKSRLIETVNAGDLIAIGKLELVVSTAVHSMKRNEGNIEVLSNFWCSELV